MHTLNLVTLSKQIYLIALTLQYTFQLDHLQILLLIIFLSRQCCNFNSFVITVDISDHLLILRVVDDIQFNEIQSDSYSKRSYSKTNINSFKNCLLITD